MILAICGPTGVGKTLVSIKLAKILDAIIINYDAMQIYKNNDIATAKISENEKENIPHYLLDIKDITDNYSVYDFQQDARLIIENNKDKNIIFVGGTGLYLKAALFDYRFNKEEQNNETYDNYTNEELYNLCIKKNRNLKIHINNRKRLIRFLNKDVTDLVEPKLLYDCYFIGLTTNRETLYQNINDRVDKMINNGLIEEAKSHYEKNINSNAYNTIIGYKELNLYFKEELELDDAIVLIKQKTRHYAKRQYTFYHNQLPVNWFNIDYKNIDHTIEEILNHIKRC